MKSGQGTVRALSQNTQTAAEFIMKDKGELETQSQLKIRERGKAENIDNWKHNNDYNYEDAKRISLEQKTTQALALITASKGICSLGH